MAIHQSFVGMMAGRRWLGAALLAGGLLLGVEGCKSGGGGAGGGGPKGFYNRYNIHVQELTGRRKGFQASYLNLTEPRVGHRIIPPNTLLVVTRGRGGNYLKLQDDGSLISFEFNAKAMKMSFDDYVKLITSPEPVPLDQFNEADAKGIKDGKAYPGMTRAGVMTALGYPAANKTASPEGKVFTYWKDERSTLTVEFDDQGVVTAVK